MMRKTERDTYIHTYIHTYIQHYYHFMSMVAKYWNSVGVSSTSSMLYSLHVRTLITIHRLQRVTSLPNRLVLLFFDLEILDRTKSSCFGTPVRSLTQLVSALVRRYDYFSTFYFLTSTSKDFFLALKPSKFIISHFPFSSSLRM